MHIIAHRGASKAAPENTLKAFRLGFAQGADGLEFDTYQVNDGIVVVHDRHLDRTTNGKGRVAEQSLDYLRSLDAGDGEQIPLLDEVLALIPAGKLCNVEIKHMSDATRWLDSLDAACANSGILSSQLLISSFNHHWLLALKQRRPTLQIGALTASYGLSAPEFARELNAWSVNIALDIVDESYVRKIKDAGYRAYVYTVDKPEDMLLLKGWGVDGIFTNLPALAAETLRK